MNADLLTRSDLALLSSLTSTPTAVSELGSPVLFPARMPNPHAVPSRLGSLRKHGLVLKSDTGGPAKTRRTLWAITPDGQTVLDNYWKAHPR